MQGAIANIRMNGLSSLLLAQPLVSWSLTGLKSNSGSKLGSPPLYWWQDQYLQVSASLLSHPQPKSHALYIDSLTSVSHALWPTDGRDCG